jgi:hypothetical protein
MIIVEHDVLFLLLAPVRIEGDTSVYELVLATLVPFECLSADLLLTVNQAVLVTVVVEIDLPDTAINLDNLLPVVRRGRAIVVLNKLKLVGETSSEYKVVLAILVVRTNFLDYQALEVLVNCDTADQTINL